MMTTKSEKRSAAVSEIPMGKHKNIKFTIAELPLLRRMREKKSFLHVFFIIFSF